MKETKKSLKIYFIVVAAFGFYSSFSLILANSDMETNLSGLVIFVLSSIFLYYGLKLYDYLENSPKTLINFVKIVFGIDVLIYLLIGKVIHAVLMGLLAWYLVLNIKRLSNEIIEAKKENKLPN